MLQSSYVPQGPQVASTVFVELWIFIQIYQVWVAQSN